MEYKIFIEAVGSFKYEFGLYESSQILYRRNDQKNAVYSKQI